MWQILFSFYKLRSHFFGMERRYGMILWISKHERCPFVRTWTTQFLTCVNCRGKKTLSCNNAIKLELATCVCVCVLELMQDGLWGIIVLIANSNSPGNVQCVLLAQWVSPPEVERHTARPFGGHLLTLYSSQYISIIAVMPHLLCFYSNKIPLNLFLLTVSWIESIIHWWSCEMRTTIRTLSRAFRLSAEIAQTLVCCMEFGFLLHFFFTISSFLLFSLSWFAQTQFAPKLERTHLELDVFELNAF